jgi:hypothetical protein
VITWVTHKSAAGHPVHVGISELEQGGSDEMFFWVVVPYLHRNSVGDRESFVAISNEGLIGEEAIGMDPLESLVEAKAWCQLKENALSKHATIPPGDEDDDDDEDDEPYHSVG